MQISFSRDNFSCAIRRFLHLCGLLMAASELWKQWILTFVVNGGNYDWWYFPFQLCSTPMYLLLLLPLCEKFFPKFQNCILTFLSTYGLLGGLAVFIDTTGLHYPLPALTIHAYTWHVLMIVIGLSAAALLAFAAPISRRIFSEHRTCLKSHKRLKRRAFLGGTGIYLFCCLVAFSINTFLGSADSINMFYINPDIPMVQVVFRDLVPYIGNVPTIFLYIGTTILGAWLVHGFWQLMFLLENKTINK